MRLDVAKPENILGDTYRAEISGRFYEEVNAAIEQDCIDV